MRFDVRAATILGFFIPGTIVLAGLCFVYPEMSQLILGIVKAPTTTGSVLIFGICFVLGALIDALAKITVELLVIRIARQHREKKGKSRAFTLDYVSKVNSENLSVFSMLVDQTQAYCDLNINTTLSFCVIVVSHSLMWKFNVVFWGALVAVLLGILISVRSRNHTVEAINGFVSSADANNPNPKVKEVTKVREVTNE